MRAKVKTTVIDTGQEYLLLVSKMNLKGILVHTAQMLEPNTQLMLELKLNEQSPLMIKGYVHKISDESSSKKGMVIAFVHPSDEVKKRIQSFIDVSRETSIDTREASSAEEQAERVAKKKSIWSLRNKKEEVKIKKSSVDKLKTQIDKPKIQPDQTMIVGEEDLPSLSLSSPDNKDELAVATMDEESLHAKSQGMAGATRHVKIDQRNPTKKTVEKKPFRVSTIYKAFGSVLVLIILVLAARPILQFMDRKFGKKFLPAAATSSTSPTQVAPNTFQTETIVDNRETGSLDSTQVDDQGGFLKVSLLGKGNFANNTISKQTDPTRIHIELLEINTLKAPATIAVNNNPVKKIDMVKNDKSVSIDIVYSGKAEPNFEAKVYPNSMDIFIYR